MSEPENMVSRVEVPACLQLRVGQTLRLEIERSHEDWLVVKAKGLVDGERSGAIYGPPKFALAALRAFFESLELPPEAPRCPECDCDLGGTEIGRLESHRPNCSRFPL